MLDQHRTRIGSYITQMLNDNTRRNNEANTLLMDIHSSFWKHERRRREEFQESHAARLAAFADLKNRSRIAHKTRQIAFEEALDGWKSRLKESHVYHDNLLREEGDIAWVRVLHRGRELAIKEKEDMQARYKISHQERKKKLEGLNINLNRNRVRRRVRGVRNDTILSAEPWSVEFADEKEESPDMQPETAEEDKSPGMQQETDEEDKSPGIQQEIGDENEEFTGSRRMIHDNTQTDEDDQVVLAYENSADGVDALKTPLCYHHPSDGPEVHNRTGMRHRRLIIEQSLDDISYDVDSTQVEEEAVRHTDFAAMIVDETQKWTDVVVKLAKQEELRESKFKSMMETFADLFQKRRRLEDQHTGTKEDYRLDVFDVASTERFEEQKLDFRQQHRDLLKTDKGKCQKKMQIFSSHLDTIVDRVYEKWLRYFELVRGTLDIDFEKLLDEYEPVPRRLKQRRVKAGTLWSYDIVKYEQIAAPVVVRNVPRRRPPRLNLDPKLLRERNLAGIIIEGDVKDADHDYHNRTVHSSPLIDVSNLDRDLEFLFPDTWAEAHVGSTIVPAVEVPEPVQLSTVTNSSVSTEVDGTVSSDNELIHVFPDEVPAVVQLSTVTQIGHAFNGWSKRTAATICSWLPIPSSILAIISLSSRLFRFIGNELRTEFIFRVLQSQRSSLVDTHATFIVGRLNQQKAIFRKAFARDLDRRRNEAMQLENRLNEEYQSYQRKQQHEFAERQDRRVASILEQDHFFTSDQGSRERLFERHLREMREFLIHQAAVRKEQVLHDWFDKIVREESRQYMRDEEVRNALTDELVSKLKVIKERRKERAKRKGLQKRYNFRTKLRFRNPPSAQTT
ncbi:hypothetical protein C0989_010903 [Termitomyces sp. Mn162]|nr:hypothetical protein C0989_010903 [Termitomyces sp. Mn162]